MARKALGRGFGEKGLGLSALVPEENTKDSVIEIDLNRLVPNRYQPRQVFDQKELHSLAASLKSNGLIQAIVVRKGDAGTYELISGERRWRASKIAGFSKISAIVKDVSDAQLMEWALLENIQREDLNPIEKAQAYERLVLEFSLSQEAIAERMGIDRSSVSNFLRLLQLPEALWKDVSENRLTMGHAKALLSLNQEEDQLRLASEIKAKKLSVRQVESLAKQIKTGKTKEEGKKKGTGSTVSIDADVSMLEDSLRRALGTKVHLIPKGSGGEIRISYYSLSDLDRILEIVT
jgi:ParB family transcriptional regulator, chromosome partitioning protein